MTIRRDLSILERQGMVKRTHGGAVFGHERMTDKFKFQKSKEENPEETKNIARKAAELILLGGNYNSVTYATSGSLTPEILERINAPK